MASVTEAIVNRHVCVWDYRTRRFLFRCATETEIGRVDMAGITPQKSIKGRSALVSKCARFEVTPSFTFVLLCN